MGLLVPTLIPNIISTQEPVIVYKHKSNPITFLLKNHLLPLYSEVTYLLIQVYKAPQYGLSHPFLSSPGYVPYFSLPSLEDANLL